MASKRLKYARFVVYSLCAASFALLYFHTYSLKIERISLSLPEFEGRFRAVLISDLHFKRENRLIKRLAQETAAAKPDFLFITGDNIDNLKKWPACRTWLGKLKKPAMSYFVPGNWEHWSGALDAGLLGDMERLGYRVLFNRGEQVKIGTERIYIAGIDDVYYGEGDPGKALKNRPGGVPVILLSHTPRVMGWLRGKKVNAVLAGDTHGGQIRWPWQKRKPVTSINGRFEMGYYRVGDSDLYVTRGVGVSVFLFRLFCRPELTIIDFQGRGHKSAKALQ